MKNKTKLDLYRNSFVSIFILLVLFSCSKEDGKRAPEDFSNIKVSVVPAAGGTVDYAPNSVDGTVELYVTPNEDYYFEKWTGDINSTENPLVAKMGASINITANFKLIPSINIHKIGEGQVQQSISKDKATNKSILTLTAKGKRTWEFTGWSGVVNSTENPLSIPFEGNINITAAFVELEKEFNAPVIKSFTFSPEEIDVTESDQVVTVTVHVTDESGVYDPALIYIENPQNTSATQQTGYLHLTSGTVKDGVYTVEITVPKGMLPGEWNITSSPFEDVFRNITGFTQPTSIKKTLTVINKNIIL